MKHILIRFMILTYFFIPFESFFVQKKMCLTLLVSKVRMREQTVCEFLLCSRFCTLSPHIALWDGAYFITTYVYMYIYTSIHTHVHI